MWITFKYKRFLNEFEHLLSVKCLLSGIEYDPLQYLIQSTNISGYNSQLAVFRFENYPLFCNIRSQDSLFYHSEINHWDKCFYPTFINNEPWCHQTQWMLVKGMPWVLESLLSKKICNFLGGCKPCKFYRTNFRGRKWFYNFQKRHIIRFKRHIRGKHKTIRTIW